MENSLDFDGLLSRRLPCVVNFVLGSGQDHLLGPVRLPPRLVRRLPGKIKKGSQTWL